MLADCSSWTSNKYKTTSVLYATATHTIDSALTAETARQTGSYISTCLTLGRAHIQQ